jgi:hypothetical protein
VVNLEWVRVAAVEEWAVRQDSTRAAGPKRNENVTRNLREAERSEKATEKNEERRALVRRARRKRDMHLPRAAPWEEMLKHELGAIPPPPENPANYR